MAVNSKPVATDHPLQFNQRDAKVIETCHEATATFKNKTLDSSCVVPGSTVAAASIVLAKLAAGVSPSHIIKFVRTGSTSATLTGVAVGDLVISILAAGSVSVAAVATINTLPAAPLVDTYTIVIRAAA